ncbi:MAG: transcriptional repressor [Anaerolineae bacterium]|nr:transcriptional repressor [Anaerolineae bacterium]
MSCEKLLQQNLRQRGLRLTPQRELVLSVLHQLEAPATVDEIYARVHTRSSSVDISTIYRTLELFQEFQLVESFDPGDGIRRYEHLGHEAPHHHLVCQICNKVIPIPLTELEDLNDYLTKTYGFVLSEGLTLPGTCKHCNETAQ